MIKSVYKYSLILIIFSTLLACSSAYNKQMSLDHKKTDSKVTYNYDDSKNNRIRLDSSNLRSNYVIKGNNLYVRLLVNNPSYMIITYIVAKNFKGNLQDIFAFTIDASTHPVTMRYSSKVELPEIQKKGSDLIVSMRLKSLKINSTLRHQLKDIQMELNNITLKEVGSLSLLKSFDDSWEYAKLIRENKFKAY